MRITLLFGTIYSGNHGVNALTYALLYLLGEAAESAGVECQYTLLGSGRKELTRTQLPIGAREFDIEFLPFVKFQRKDLLFPRRHRHFTTLKDSCLVFDTGEGDSFSDIYGRGRFRKHTNPKFYVWRIGRRLVLPPQTVGPFSSRFSRLLAPMALKRAALAVSRDEPSYQYIRRFLPADRVLQSIDVAFFLPFEPSTKDPRQIRVGVNVSGLLWHGGYTGANMFGLKSDYRETVLKVLGYLSREPNVQIHLVAHVIPPNYPVEDDMATCRALLAQFPSAELAPAFRTPMEAKGYISGMDFFVGSRMHACIAAYSAGVPVHPIGYSRKFTGLFRDTLKYPHVSDAVERDSLQIAEAVTESFVGRKGIRQKLLTAQDAMAAKKVALVESFRNQLRVCL